MKKAVIPESSIADVFYVRKSVFEENWNVFSKSDGLFLCREHIPKPTILGDKFRKWPCGEAPWGTCDLREGGYLFIQ